MVEIPGHHLVHGTCRDYLTGEQLPDTDDERIRQQLARLLVEEKGYSPEELIPRLKIETLFAGHFVTSLIDFAVRPDGRYLFIVRYGPGSLVTRERPAIAAARVLVPEYRIPLAVVTNGREAELLDTSSGKVLGCGLEAIPDRALAAGLAGRLEFLPLPADKQREKELRILNAYDEEVCCVGGPCALPGAPEG